MSIDTSTRPSATGTAVGGADRLGRTWQAARTGTITLSLREVRLVVERLLQAEGLTPGAVPAVRDHLLTAQAAGLPALETLRAGLSTADRAHGGAVRVTAETPGALVVDGLGQHSYVVAPAVMDLALGTEPGPHGVSLWVTGIEDAFLLTTLAAQGRGFGARVRVVVHDTAPRAFADVDAGDLPDGFAAAPGAWVHADRRPPGPIADPALARLADLTGSLATARAVHTGMTVDGDLWWHLFEASASALAPESITSLKHAGATPVNDRGEIEPDLTDDQDFAGPAATTRPAPGSKDH